MRELCKKKDIYVHSCGAGMAGPCPASLHNVPWQCEVVSVFVWGFGEGGCRTHVAREWQCCPLLPHVVRMSHPYTKSACLPQPVLSSFRVLAVVCRSLWLTYAWALLITQLCYYLLFCLRLVTQFIINRLGCIIPLARGCRNSLHYVLHISWLIHVEVHLPLWYIYPL